jgi:hypothetical protein
MGIYTYTSEGLNRETEIVGSGHLAVDGVECINVLSENEQQFNHHRSAFLVLFSNCTSESAA